MIPSKSPYSSGWSSTFTARRLSLGSYDGPLGTAHDRRTPSISRRRSKWSRRAACLWTMNNRPGTVETVPIGSGVVSGDRLARYALRLSTWGSSSLLGVTCSVRFEGNLRSGGEGGQHASRRTLAAVHDLRQRPRPPATIPESYACTRNRYGHHFVRARFSARQSVFVLRVEGEYLVQHAPRKVRHAAQAAVHLPERQRDSYARPDGKR